MHDKFENISQQDVSQSVQSWHMDNKVEDVVLIGNKQVLEGRGGQVLQLLPHRVPVQRGVPSQPHRKWVECAGKEGTERERERALECLFSSFEYSLS